MKNSNGLSYACLFGGGAIRGMAFIGAIKALEELRIKPSKFAGSSVGSIIAVMYAFGYTAEEIKEKFIDVNFNLFKDIQFGFGKTPALSKGNVFLDWVREIVEEKFYGKDSAPNERKPVTFKDLKEDLVIITTDIENFKCQEFSKYTTPDYEIASAVRISCCMPGLMKPMEYKNKLLVDGDLQKSVPMWQLSETLQNSKERILELRLEGTCGKDGEVSNGIDYANAVYSCMTSISSEFISRIYGKRDKFDYIIVNTGDILLVNFNIGREEREQLIQSGYEQTINYFKNILPVKKKVIVENYNIIHGHLLRIYSALKVNNFKLAKVNIGELFINLIELYRIINLDDFKKIKSFKDMFFSNYKELGIFGISKLKNSQMVKSELKNIITAIEEKIEELNSYIKLFE